ncbi:hemolysin family protein [Ureibacillus chungkukjangi]|uniref:CBS domain containing-hemolysin-like protein n=1 Tax=Ureibacillus chungkukjangi TaxID=1202712 RepID=A0A318TYR7_9BACL|nr:hemolysin family protein [Ureibacillus chungkukjangi]MCM3390087.1 hemolysin family protein [Ureibacillus chungkukjangi]PYF07245.1 CBS domain containing-hemolysin-like protein [Ureibacillus chungkukjangi]
MTALNLTIFAILLALTAFFVATEFAIVKVRHSRIDQLVAEERKGALAAKHVTTHLDEYLSACQLGITVTALGIGMVGESTFEFILEPLFGMFGIASEHIHYFTIAAAFVIATFLHVVVGELAPKTAAIQKAETITLSFAKPIMIFYKILYPFIWFLNGAARILVGIFGMKPASEHELSHTEEELRLLMTESFKNGEINQNELNYVNNVFEFDARIAREIMVPRTDIIAFDKKATYDEVLTTIQEERYTRYPVYEEDRDNIIGFINIKDFLTQGMTNRITVENFNIENFINPVIYTTEVTPIQVLLTRMQKERTHIAILLDEYGGTSGLVTVEDILEVLVGEIRDEFDDDEIPEIRKVNDGHFIVYSKILLEEVARFLNIEMDNSDVDTLGGWYYSQDMELKQDYIIEHAGYTFSIHEIDGLQLRYIEIKQNSNLTV